VARKLKKKILRDRVLLVSEGKKTEQNYFKGLCQALRISIEITDINKTSPDSLFTKAKRMFDRAKREKKPFTQVILIVDKDNFTHYEKTKQKIAGIDNFHAFFSEPCFEYWLLLHYENTTKPFTCFDELKKDRMFKKHFPDYQKNQDVFTNLQDRIPAACQNAENNPHTNIHKLIEYLQNIKNR